MNDHQPRCYSYIRFSSPEQIKGNSLTRQLEMSEKYAKEHGFQLDRSLTMKDLGLSAFSGDHRKRGALGHFIALIDAGKVPRSSTLLVESLDRLSREQVLDAFDQFRQIIKQGIKIVTLTDGMEYSEETLNANIGNLMISLTIMSRAYEESHQKSKRLRAAWDTKRKHLDDRKLTKLCPAWLTYKTDADEFIILEDRQNLVERIFKLSLGGKGIASIAKQFNLEGIPTWSSNNNGWQKSYIHKILNNRSVLGEFQPHIKRNGKREPSGDPIENYFPRIISDDLFYQTQNRLRSNASKGGKTGNVRNLFGTIAKCAYCGSSMQFINKGKPPKGGSYLVCDKARRGLGCHYIMFRYNDFENAFLKFCVGLNFQDLLTADDDKRKNQIALLKGQHASVKARLKDTDRKIENLGNALGGESNQKLQEYIKKQLAEALDQQHALVKENKQLASKINGLNNDKKEAKKQISALHDLISFMHLEGSEKVIDVRLRLRAEIREIVDRVEVLPSGNLVLDFKREEVNSILDDLKSRCLQDGLSLNEAEQEVEKAKALLDRQFGPKDNLRAFVIHFKNGNMRMVAPDGSENPQLILKSEFIAGEQRHSKKFIERIIDRKSF